MQTETRTTDAKARLVLPRSFANATVVTEQLSETGVRVRRAKVVAEDDLPFTEEATAPLSDRDRDHFLSLLAAPPSVGRPAGAGVSSAPVVRTANGSTRHTRVRVVAASTGGWARDVRLTPFRRTPIG